VSQFVQYEFPSLEVKIDGVAHAATFAVASRARHYAGKWVIAPDADPVGDTFDVLLFAESSHARLAQLFQQMAAGRAGHLKNGLSRIVRGRKVSIRSLDGNPVEVQVDGDCVLATPISCHVGDETVRVLVPATD
ncbi:MAG TPA: hypothetical protein VMT25_02420, partial [Thermoanaerobaculia bacterium]|nr:hypothetical protein [Thermoanaerobaculia bacterium]